MKGRDRAKINALDVRAKTKMEIDQEPCQSNVSINDASMKVYESVWICVFCEHEKFSYIIGLAFVIAVV